MAYLISDQKVIHLFIYFVSITGMKTWSTTPAWKGLSQTEKNRKYNHIIFLKDDKQFWMLWRWCSGDTGTGKRRMKVLEDLSPTEGQNSLSTTSWEVIYLSSLSLLLCVLNKSLKPAVPAAFCYRYSGHSGKALHVKHHKNWTHKEGQSGSH